MSTEQPLRHNDYLDHMLEAIGLIRSYVEDFSKEDFLADRRTQQAVILNKRTIGDVPRLPINSTASLSRN